MVLLLANQFVPHGHCYLWQPELVWLHVISDGLSAIAYYFIPVTLLYFVYKRRDLPFDWIFLSFAGFITACGTTHLLEIWTLWHPDYWLSGAVKTSNAALSLCTAVLLVRLVPKALSLPGPAHLEAANRELEDKMIAHQKTEAALRDSEERFRSAFDYAAIGMTLTGLDGRFLKVNRSMTERFGYSEAELLSLTFQAITHPEDLTTDCQQTQQMLRGEIGSYQMEKRYFHQQGYVVWVLLSVSLVRDPAGQPLYFVAQMQDISERKQVEVAQQRSEAERERVAEQLRSSLEEKEVLLKEIHHRVKNNLQIISSLLDLQSNRVADQQMQNILLESQTRISAMALVHESLYSSENFARINLANYVRRLANYLCQTYQRSANQTQLNLRVSPGISVSLQQAIPCGLLLNELITNAFKHGLAQQKHGQIYIRFETEAQDIVLAVSNDGDHLPTDFDIHSIASLGLKLVATLVRQLKGTLELQRGDRTTFTVRFANNLIE